MKKSFFMVILVVLLVGAAMPESGESARTVDDAAPGSSHWLTGQLLVAAPALKGPVFGETVILVINHDAGGALGIILNRPTESRTLAELMRNFGVEGADEAPEREITVHFGGPVSPARGIVVHSADFADDSSVGVNDFALASSPRIVLRALARGKGPRHAVFAAGYAGWGPGQLEGELAQRSWVIAMPDAGFVFGRAYSTMWRRALDRRFRDL